MVAPTRSAAAPIQSVQGVQGVQGSLIDARARMWLTENPLHTLHTLHTRALWSRSA